MANLYADQQKYTEAESYYLKAIEKGNINALYNLANLYKDQQKYKEGKLKADRVKLLQKSTLL